MSSQYTMGIASDIPLMESVLAGEGHSELGDASMEAIVTSVQLGVPLDADVERPRERRGEGEAERDAAAPERHTVAEVGVRRDKVNKCIYVLCLDKNDIANR